MSEYQKIGIGIAVVTILISVGSSLLASGMYIGGVKTVVEAQGKEIDKREPLVDLVPQIKKTVEDNTKSLGTLQREFHAYQIQQLQLQGEQSRKLDAILDKLK